MSENCPFVTVVSGVPRSGTSLMMQMLAAGGLPPLVDDQRPADPSNPRGYFEFDPVKRLRLDRSWLDRANGHAVKIIHLLLRELPTDGQFNYRVLMMIRPLAEVVASQTAMLERSGKKGAPADVLIATYQNQLRDVRDWLGRHECFQCIDVPYHDLLTQTPYTAHRINEFLDIKLDIEAMTSAVSPSLCHHRSDVASA